MTRLTFLLTILFLNISCDKREKEINDGYLAGRLMYMNPDEINSSEKPVSKGIIKVAYAPSDALNYITTVTADNDGYFVVEGLKRDRAYLLFYSDSIQHVLYSGKVENTTNKDNIKLLVKRDSITQNGFRITVATESNEAPKEAQLCVFRNQEDWQSDTCKNSLYSLQVPADGQIASYNLPPGNYYFIASASVSGRYSKGKGKLEVGVNDIAKTTIVLHPVPITGFRVTIQDKGGTPVNDAQICAFRSRDLLFRDTCGNRLFDLYTDPNGEAYRDRLSVGWYYLRVEGPPNSNMHTLDSIEVKSNLINTKTISFK